MDKIFWTCSIFQKWSLQYTFLQGLLGVLSPILPHLGEETAIEVINNGQDNLDIHHICRMVFAVHIFAGIVGSVESYPAPSWRGSCSRSECAPKPGPTGLVHQGRVD